MRTLPEKGFMVIESMYTSEEVDRITDVIESSDKSAPLFRKDKDLFAIRQFFKAVPAVIPLLFTDKLRTVITELFGDNFFVVKSLYFDKPGDSNWYVSYHQDLTISVNKKAAIEGYGPWTMKHEQFAVQPPVNLLENNFTIRVHLDDTNEENGALRVLPGSHSQGIRRAANINALKENEIICAIPKGGIMIMRPLLFHASGRTTNLNRRRVIHIEFSNQVLPSPLDWSEKLYTLP